MNNSLHLEFIVHTYDATLHEIKAALSEFGENLQVFDAPAEPGIRGRNYRVTVSSEEPTAVFDACAHFGRIKSVKVT